MYDHRRTKNTTGKHMRTQNTLPTITRSGTSAGGASRTARTDAAVIAQYIQDLIRAED